MNLKNLFIITIITTSSLVSSCNILPPIEKTKINYYQIPNDHVQNRYRQKMLPIILLLS